MHGDHVETSAAASGRGGQRAEGRIRVQTAHPSVVGLFRYGLRGNVVLPYDTRIQHQVEIPPGDELTPALRKKFAVADSQDVARVRRIGRIEELDGAVVNVELMRFPKGGIAAVGRVIEILGKPGDLGVDTEIIIRKHHLPHEFSARVLEEAERRAKPVGESELEGRQDFRSLPIVTIDGETARDFDDAVYVERRQDGGWHLQVHIADVAHYVRTVMALDNEARLRGTSVYFIDRAVPMLPESLSNGICSLNPREDRLVMSCLMEFDASGRMRESRMTAGVIRSAERMTYTNVNKVLEGDAEMSARYAPLVHCFQDMKTLALLLNARRNERGSIDFDLPEPVIEFDAEQRMTNITRSERNIAHRLIEEFMLAANRAVAGYLLRRGLPTLHRVHEKPDARKVLEFEEVAKAFGYTLGVEDLHRREINVKHGRVPAPARAGRADSHRHGRERSMKISLPVTEELSITPQHYQRLLKKLVGKTEERIVSYLMLRSLKQARYAADSFGHFALGFDEYAHFTSPIRRYPDLIVHRTLKWALAHPQQNAPLDAHPAAHAEAVVYSHQQLEELATETSDAERRAGLRRTRIARLEDGAIHGRASRRRVRRLDHFGAEIRMLRGIVRSVCGRALAHRGARRRGGNALHVPRTGSRDCGCGRAGAFAQRARCGKSEAAQVGTRRPRESPRRAHRSHAPPGGVCVAGLSRRGQASGSRPGGAAGHHLLLAVVEGDALAGLNRGYGHAQGDRMAVAGFDMRIGSFSAAHAFHQVAHVGAGRFIPRHALRFHFM